MGKENLVIFRNLFLPGRNDVESPWFHYRWSHQLLEETDNYVIEGYRNSGKSSIVFNAYHLYCLAYPDESRAFILLICHDESMASERLGEIKETYKSNPLINLNLVKINEDNSDTFEAVVKDENDKDVRMRVKAVGKGSSVRIVTGKQIGRAHV